MKEIRNTAFDILELNVGFFMKNIELPKDSGSFVSEAKIKMNKNEISDFFLFCQVF